MKTVEQIMSKQHVTASADQKLSEIAKSMQSQATGMIPVLEGNKVVGVVTDRDIALRGLAAEGAAPESLCARDAMTSPAVCAHAEDEVKQAAETMQQQHVRRLPVLDRQDQLVGVVSVDDLALSGFNELAGQTLSAVTAEREPPLAIA